MLEIVYTCEVAMKKTIILITKTDLLQYRFETLLDSIDHELIISASKIETLKHLNYLNNQVDLFIFDLDDSIEMFSLIQEVKERDIQTPIILLSSFNDKNTFLNAIKLGIDDFIIKPFDDERMNLTINKYLISSEPQVKNQVRNYEKDLSLEIKKANKGSYPITFISFNFIGKNKLYLANAFMKKLQEEKWDTDKALFYKKHHILGIFPFSGKKNLKVIEEKMKFYYQSITNNKNAYKQSDMILGSYIYPDDVKNFDHLIDELQEGAIH